MDNNISPISPIKEKSTFNKLFSRLWEMILNKKFMVFAFFVPIFIMVALFVLVGMLPLGKTSVLVLDMNAQYIYFFEQLRDVLHGKASLFYTFERALGGEFFGYYTYYLASPLSLIVALFPKSLIYEAITTMMVLKAGLSGLTFSIYLYKTRPVNSIGFGMFSVMYALCAYATAYQTNIMWQDALIFLPLIALGIEILIKNGKLKLFIISLALAIWSNYYIGYMLCIFTLLYFVFYLVTHSKDVRNPNGVKLHTLKSVGRYVLAGIVALMLSAGVLFTALYSLSFGKANFDLSKLTFELNIDFLDIFAKMFIGSFDTFRAEGFPHIYAGTIVLLMLPLFYMSKKIKLREKIGYTVLALVLVASFSINAINLVWHCFNYPVWLNYRYSFIFTFVLLLMAYRGYERLEEFKFKLFAYISGFLVIMLFIMQKVVTFTRWNGDNETQMKLGYATVWLTIGLLVGYLVILFLLKAKKHKARTVSLVLCGVVCVEALTSACLSWVGQFSDAGWSTSGNYNSFKDSNECITEFLEEKELEGFFRAERLFSRESNDNLVLNINGVTEFTSTFNKGSKEFLKKLGYETRDQSSKYRFTNELADSLLGIKYIISDELINENTALLDKSDIYEEIAVLDEKYTVYENKFALSIAYAVSPKIKEAQLDKQLTAERYALYIAGLMLDQDLGANVTANKLNRIYPEFKKGELQISDFSDTSIKGTLVADSEKVVFTTIPYDKMWKVYVDGEKVDTYKCIDSMLAFDIGEGEHEIEMRYVSMQWYIGLSISVVGLASLLVICVIEEKKRFRLKKETDKKEEL